jgi:hypothetical protein
MTHYVQGVGNVSDYERQMLDALVRNGKPSAPKTPAELIHDYPSTFGNRSPQGVHQTAASLVRKGLIYRLHDEAGHVCYEINYAGLSAIREIRR